MQNTYMYVGTSYFNATLRTVPVGIYSNCVWCGAHLYIQNEFPKRIYLSYHLPFPEFIYKTKWAAKKVTKHLKRLHGDFSLDRTKVELNLELEYFHELRWTNCDVKGHSYDLQKIPPECFNHTIFNDRP